MRTYKDGTLVKSGDTISQDLADALLEGRLACDWGLLVKLVPGWRQFNVNQQAALLSFSYNCGPALFGGLDALRQSWRSQRGGPAEGEEGGGRSIECCAREQTHHG
ncbi:hypothetical protein KBZ07_14040 [Cyanobium sp. BA20m-14]|nr:hypothetical protein [Cyanobium sp. BA20m-14]MCP9914497.1 hypothetical protein [Cyanobium sp. BA20m-14]